MPTPNIYIYIYIYSIVYSEILKFENKNIEKVFSSEIYSKMFYLQFQKIFWQWYICKQNICMIL